MTKRKELTEQEALFISCLLGEARGNIRSALAMAGYSEHTKFKDVVHKLRDEILEAAKDALVLGSLEASFSLLGVLVDGNAPGTANKIKAAQEILNRVGVSTKDGVDLKVPSGGIVIMPAKEFKNADD